MSTVEGGFLYKDEKACRIDLWHYQRMLRLTEWRITLHFNVPAAEIPIEEVSGAMQWNLQHKSAHLYLLDPKEYPPGLWAPQDQEEDLVHELLHLLYAPFDDTKPGSARDTALEFSINTVSAAIVRERRRADDNHKKWHEELRK